MVRGHGHACVSFLESLFFFPGSWPEGLVVYWVFVGLGGLCSVMVMVMG